MRVALLLVVVLALLSLLPASQAQGGSTTICGHYTAALFGSDTPANETALITAIVTRAAVGGSGVGFNGYTVLGLFNASGPLYALFTGQVQYRSGAPNYVTSTTDQAVLAGHLVSYFGALFGCQIGAAGGIPAVHSSDMYGIHQNMGITATMENYFNSALANTLYSFGVTAADVGTAATVLSLFNRYGSPIMSSTVGNSFISNSNSSGLTQICGDPSCPLAMYANPALYTSSNSASATLATPVVVAATLLALIFAVAL